MPIGCSHFGQIAADRTIRHLAVPDRLAQRPVSMNLQHAVPLFDRPTEVMTLNTTRYVPITDLETDPDGSLTRTWETGNSITF